MTGAPCSVGTDPDTGERMALFYGGPFSQWAACDLAIDGFIYNCAEQYMMAQKACFFQDYHALHRILASRSPSEQKAIGRQVEGFDAERWALFSRDVVRTASLVKFTLPRFRRALTWTGDRTIVEASPSDVIWGIGLGQTDPQASHRVSWRGTNWLGQVLMEVRAILR